MGSEDGRRGYPVWVDLQVVLSDLSRRSCFLSRYFSFLTQTPVQLLLDEVFLYYGGKLLGRQPP